MLSIGDFSKICNVSTKTLRYYAEIGLILPNEINNENGYRYYSIEQLETMLFIKRLKAYNFSLEQIKIILQSEELRDEKLYLSLIEKKKEIDRQAFKMEGEELQQYLHFKKRGSVKENKKGGYKGKYSALSFAGNEVIYNLGKLWKIKRQD